LARKARRRANVVCAILFMLVTGAIGGAFTYTERGLKAARAGAEDIAEQYAQAARPIEQFQKLQEKQRTMAHQAELTSSLIEKVPRSFLLAELTNSLPAGVSLIDLVLESRRRQAPAAPPPSAFQAKQAQGAAQPAAAAPQVQPVVYEVTLKVTGMAANDVQVAQFISKLNGSRLLKDVNLVVSDEFKRGDDTLRKFQMEMTLNPSAEIDHLGARQTKTAAIDMTGK